MADMEPILSKQEIADLLRTIRGADPPVEERGAAVAGRPADHPRVDLFDVASVRATALSVPHFDIIIEDFAAKYQRSLANLLQHSVNLEKKSLALKSFGRYQQSGRHAGATAVIHLAPMQHGALLVCDSQLSFTLLEIMLGASPGGTPSYPERSLTRIELSVLRLALHPACAHLDRSFDRITPLHTSLLRVEADPGHVNLTNPEANVAVATFRFSIDKRSAGLDLVIPAAALEPHAEAFSELLNLNAMKKHRWSVDIGRQVATMPVTVKARCGSLSLTLEQLLKMRVGDVLELDFAPDETADIFVEDQLKFHGRPVASRRHGKAVEITGTVN